MENNIAAPDRGNNAVTKLALIQDEVRSGMDRGEWKAGEKLPSVRSMAERLGVHRLTVLKAYRLLEEEGLLYSRYKNGYYVRAQVEAKPDTPDGDAASGWAYAAAPGYVNSSRLSDIHSMKVSHPMSEALIDPALLPNRFLSNHVKQVLDLHPMVLSTYSTVLGDPELREALSAFFAEDHGIDVDAGELLITSGSQQAIDLVSRSLVKPGDRVLIERPTYSPAIDVFQQQNIILLPVELTAEGYDLDAVEALMEKEKPRLFYMNPTFHNPTGYTVPAKQRKLLVELAERHDCILVEDDVYHDIYFDQPPPPPLFYYDTEGYVVYIRSFSKYIAPGLRISVLAARPSVMEGIRPLKALSDSGSPLLNQKIFQHYFFSSRMQEHVQKLRTAVRMRKDVMEKALARTGWSWDSPDGGLNLWISLPDEIPADLLLERCVARSVSFVPGSICDPLGKMNARIRLSYSFLSEKRIAEAVEQLIEAAEELRS